MVSDLFQKYLRLLHHFWRCSQIWDTAGQERFQSLGWNPSHVGHLSPPPGDANVKKETAWYNSLGIPFGNYGNSSDPIFRFNRKSSSTGGFSIVIHCRVRQRSRILWLFLRCCVLSRCRLLCPGTRSDCRSPRSTFAFGKQAQQNAICL